MTRQVLGATFLWEDHNTWTVEVVTGVPGAPRSIAPRYTVTATFIPRETPGPDGEDGELRIATATRDDDRELVCRFVVALVAAATGGSPEPPELES